MAFMRKSYIFYIAFVSIVLLSGCTDEESKKRYAPTAAHHEIRTISFGIHPYLNSKKMYSSYRPILDYLQEHIPDTSFVLETSADYARYDEKLYSGKFDISLPNPYQTYNALSHGYEAVARMRPDDVFRGIFVARKDMNITKVKQLKNKTISFPAPTALAATMMPLYYLHKQGLNINTDFKKRFVGSQYSSILNAYTKDALIAATWPPPWEAWCKENPLKAQEMQIVWQTEPLINNGLVVKKGFDPYLRAQIVSLLVNMHNDSKGKKLLEDAGFEGFVASNDDDFKIVEQFLREYKKAGGKID